MNRAILLSLLATLIVSAPHAFASTTDGTINSTDRWAWSANAGWIDFGTTAGAVHVTDSALTGYAYSENLGWISLNCVNSSSCADNSYAVANDGLGTLSGFGWGENTGWIDFAPSAGGTSINSSGVFSGTAYAENLGWITFATDHPVTTDWRATVPTPAPAPAPATHHASSSAVICATGFTWNPSKLACTSPSGQVFSVNAPTDTPITISPTTLPSATASPSALSFPRNLQIGDRGEDIRMLQIFLNGTGLVLAASGVGSPGSESTFFGTLTYRALVRFQTANELPPTGYFGPLTRAFITTHF